MSDMGIYKKAMERARTNGVDMLSYTDVVVFLEKEIDMYRETIKNLESYIEDLRKALIDRESETAMLDVVQENTAGEIIKALADNGYNTITINCYKNIESEG